MDKDHYELLQEIEKEKGKHKIKEENDSDYREFDDFVSKVRELTTRDYKKKVAIITRVKGVFLVVTLYLLIAFVWFYGWSHLNMQWEFLAAPIMLVLTWVMSRHIGAIVFIVVFFGSMFGVIVGGAVGAIYGVIHGAFAIVLVTVGFFAFRLTSIGIEKVACGFLYQCPIVIIAFIVTFIVAIIVAMFIAGFIYAALEKIQSAAIDRNFGYFDDVTDNIIPKIKGKAFLSMLLSYLLFPPFIFFLALLFSQICVLIGICYIYTKGYSGFPLLSKENFRKYLVEDEKAKLP